MDEIELGPIETGWGSALAKRAGTDCPLASDLVDFVDRGQSANCFGAVVQHLAVCAACRRIVLEMREAGALVAPPRSAFGGFLRPSAVWGGLLGAAAVLAVGSVWFVSRWNGSPASESRVAVRSEARQPGMPSKPLVEPNSRPETPGTGPGPRVATNRDVRPSGAVRPVPNFQVHGGPDDIDDATMPPASQQYCLIGSDGVFSMPSPSFHHKEREQIEKKYADQVKSARDTYNAHLAVHAASSPATSELNRSLSSAAADRDRQLGAIYTKQAVDPGTTLNLKLEADTPYQVVEVHYRTYRHALKPVKLVVHEPWAGYRPVRKPYGWEYGVAYAPQQFKSKYAEWRRGYLAEGRPAFCGLEGHEGPVSAPNIVGSRHEGYADRRLIERGPAVGQYTHQTAGVMTQTEPGPAGQSAAQAPLTHSSASAGYIHSSAPHGSQAAAGTPGSGYMRSQGLTDRAGYSHTTGQPPSGSSNAPAGPPPGRYTHGGPVPTSGYSHSQKGSKSNSEYTHQHHEGEKGGGENHVP